MQNNDLHGCYYGSRAIILHTFGGKEGNIELQSLYDIFPTTPSASVRFEMATFLKDSKSPTAPGLFGNTQVVIYDQVQSYTR